MINKEAMGSLLGRQKQRPESKGGSARFRASVAVPRSSMGSPVPIRPYGEGGQSLSLLLTAVLSAPVKFSTHGC